MLGTSERMLLVEALAPPAAGYRLDRAVATTFTLDLTALLPIPLAFAGRDLGDDLEPISAMQAIRNYASRIDVYFQAGHVRVESKFHTLLAFLEPVVHPIMTRGKGDLFHPKIWLARYRSATTSDPDRYKFVCGSRNLTNDRAWDVVVALDGVETRRTVAVNAPLVEFVQSLPGRATTQRADRAAAVAKLADAVGRVVWDAPANADPDVPLRFHWLSVGRRAPKLRGSRRLVVSPFLNEAGIDTTAAVDDADVTIISRPESFDALETESKQWLTDEPPAQCLVLNEAAAIPELESDDAGPRWSLSGLHAKLYIVERSKQAHVLIGSANATSAGWGLNDEFMVEIVGRVKDWGIDAFVPSLDTSAEDRHDRSFRSVLLEHTFGEPVDPESSELDAMLAKALRTLAGVPLRSHVAQDSHGGWVQRVTPLALPEMPASLTDPVVHVAVFSQPGITCRWDPDGTADWSFELAGIDQITPFLVIEVTGRYGSTKRTARTVVLSELVDEPPDRLDQILAAQFRDRDTFLRFVLLLLALADDPEVAFTGDGLFDGTGSWKRSSQSLLESLVHALARSPHALDDVAHVVERLQRTTAGRELLPHGWDDLWSAITDARKTIHGRRPVSP